VRKLDDRNQRIVELTAQLTTAKESLQDTSSALQDAERAKTALKERLDSQVVQHQQELKLREEALLQGSDVPEGVPHDVGSVSVASTALRSALQAEVCHVSSPVVYAPVRTGMLWHDWCRFHSSQPLSASVTTWNPSWLKVTP
jgi:hypothetical protein